MPITPPVRPKIVIPYPGAEPEYCGLGPISRKDYEAPRIDISRTASPYRPGVLVGGAPPVGHAAAFNWHDVNGVDWMSPVKNQLGPSCWAHGAVGALEACINIAENNPDLDLNLSEQHLTSNCCTACNLCPPDPKAGWGWCSQALQFIRTNGICDENCFPHTNEICAPCTPCAGGNLHSCYSTPYINETVDSFKTALETYGPLVVVMQHDADWMHRGDGGSNWSNHCVVLCGWQDDYYMEGGGYWILKNSHGTRFSDPGEDAGYGRIRYGVLERHNYAQAVILSAPLSCEDHSTQATCEAANCYWYGDACHTDPEPIPCSDHTNQTDCEAANCYWYGDACHTDQEFPISEIVSYSCPEDANPGDEIIISAVVRNNSQEVQFLKLKLLGDDGHRFEWWRQYFPADSTQSLSVDRVMPAYDWNLRLELWREV